ncbi:MAG: Nif3-like dinuclear metal center hexameric protein [Puniceicoccales bacterium]|jgi:dinuclear metal center YbgI/SA1388 family protein|nr:Nif3-like dinuclear metal center hexameric protein [Puniceicoccales bacterium]
MENFIQDLFEILLCIFGTFMYYLFMNSSLFEVIQYCDERLNIEAIADEERACNGLQFQNSGEINKIAAAVDASLEVIEKAAAIEANFLIVHHGLFWGATIPIRDAVYEKYKYLIAHDIALYSCHLPLDAHPEIGNNAILAKILGLTNTAQEFEFHHAKIGMTGNRSIERSKFKSLLQSTFPHVVAMEFGPNVIDKVGIVSGSSGVIIAQAKDLAIHTVVIGECQQYYYNVAQENKVNAYACGHYATEIFGVQALGKEVSQKFSLPFEFIATDCPL